MITMGASVLLASLLGSLHCVGMCGPVAIWIVDEQRSLSVIVAYHFGRLTTYLSAGLAAGVVGSMVTLGGQVAGLQSLASVIAGIALIGIGTGQIVRRYRASRQSVRIGTNRNAKPSLVVRLLIAAKPALLGYGPATRAYVGGLLTTWLPCGWLYLFLLVAAGTGDPIRAVQVMGLFWLGTLPALTGVVVGMHSLGRRFQRLVPLATSLMLVATGVYAATGRAAADLQSLQIDPALRSGETVSIGETVESLHAEPLPCCREDVK